jgi:hypothetical protein
MDNYIATARRMIARYGAKEARVVASGYASGVWYAQNEYVRAFWLGVVRAIDAEVSLAWGCPSYRRGGSS